MNFYPHDILIVVRFVEQSINTLCAYVLVQAHDAEVREFVCSAMNTQNSRSMPSLSNPVAVYSAPVSDAPKLTPRPPKTSRWRAPISRPIPYGIDRPALDSPYDNLTQSQPTIRSPAAFVDAATSPSPPNHPQHGASITPDSSRHPRLPCAQVDWDLHRRT
ncbi:hypothetical protein R3P38DRAFT_3195587 [Favolaschia claudopus]|uniref:Uncharacterized protein n=1 Tax=Favolaschia claudopus TaxID=2862362 RepID=A0AAW0B937_9AGAR